jgi:hypothetical protein
LVRVEQPPSAVPNCASRGRLAHIEEWEFLKLNNLFLRKSLTLTVRLIVLVSAGLCGIAIELGRLAPRPVDSRRTEASVCLGLDDFHFRTPQSQSRFLDPESGKYFKVSIPANDRFDHASCSPWKDGRGESQVAGRWTLRTRSRSGLREDVAQEFGLARYTFPGGEVLDHVATDVVLNSRPCWIPGPLPRILFTAGDGQLYRFDFEDSDGRLRSRREGDAHPDPYPLRWRTPPPGEGLITLRDPTWPTTATWERRIIVSLSYQERREDGTRAFADPQLWWLRLNPEVTAIEEAGRLTHPEPSLPRFKEIMPGVTTLPGGGLVVAYLTQQEGQCGWSLRVAPLAPDAASERPQVDDRAGLDIAEHCVAAPLTFSADGRWVYSLIRAAPDQILPRRHSVSEASRRPRCIDNPRQIVRAPHDDQDVD